MTSFSERLESQIRDIGHTVYQWQERLRYQSQSHVNVCLSLSPWVCAPFHVHILLFHHFSHCRSFGGLSA